MRLSVAWRIAVTVAAIVAVESIACGLAAAPIVACWWWFIPWSARLAPAVRVGAAALALVPSYAVFALMLIPWSAAATWATRARTPSPVDLRIADFDWRLMTWARYMAAIHVVRVVSGKLFRGSPVWTWYLRLNGARVGRRVYVNTTAISDHNLLDIADDVVIGADVHLAGHTVERGIVRTGSVRIGRGAMVGLGTLIDIDVEIGTGCQVGALSVVPKHSRLDADATYAGIPARRIEHQ